MPTEQEQSDLSIMQTKMASIRENAFYHLRDILRMDATQLKHSGHRTTCDALTYSVKATLADLDAVVKAHLVKYPD